MTKLPREVSEFMERFKVASDELWEVRPGTGNYAIKHKALERVAAEQGIAFEPPTMLEFHAADKIAVLCVTGRLGDRVEWSIGEAAPYNNKNGFPFAMSEKRAKDRVILKLLNIHGALYSEAEADEFREAGPGAKRQNPHVTRPEDIVPAIDYDQHGEPIDNIPSGDPGIERLSKAKAREDFAAAQNEMRATKTEADLKRWADRNANRIQSYPPDWQDIIRGLYAEHRDDLRQGVAA
jgi:hypothetical protein